MEQKGASVPALNRKPDLPALLEWYLDAFYDLNTCRNNGMELGRIPWLAARQYAADADADPDRFWSLIKAMDVAFLDFVKSKRAT